MALTQFTIVRYQFYFKVTEPILLPEYAGSTLRGAFGRALRKIACMTKQENCKECPLYRTCPYTNIFETPAPAEHDLQKFSQVPNGYIIEPPSWGEKIYSLGEELIFSVVLFGRLVEQLPLIAFAFKRAFEYNVGKGKADLIDIAKVDEAQTAMQSILVGDNIIPHHKEMIMKNNLPTALSIKIQTPLRLQENGKPLRENQINAERFFISLAKRISLLSEFHYQPLNLNFEQIKQDISQVKENKNLRWQDWTRYSSRQDQRMKLGGVVGEWHFADLSPQLAQLLYVGQWLHNGKNATFGLGKYQITNL